MYMNPLTVQRPKLQTAVLKFFLAEDFNFGSETLLAGSGGVERFLDVGTVVGQITQGAVTVSAAVANTAPANTGNGTVALGTPAYIPGAAQVGNYEIIYLSATEFQVLDPFGNDLGVGKNGTAFTNQIVFTNTAGGTAFVAGDGFTIPVAIAAGGGQVVALGQTAGTTNGTTASGNAVLHFAAVPASVQAGMVVTDLTSPSVIPAGTTVLSTTATTVTMSANAAGAGVGAADSIAFNAPDGSNVPVGIIMKAVTAASGTDNVGGAVTLRRGPAVVLMDGLIWPAGQSAAQQTAALATLLALGIVARNS